MPPVFTDEFKESVRTQTDIAALVSESVALTPKAGGREYVGLCPFHEDHNPSLIVYPERQSYRCWSCDEGGDCFSWVMKIEAVEFREALEMLARRANIEIPRSLKRSTAGADGRDEKQQQYDCLAWAAEEFHQCLKTLPQAESARRYLAERGFAQETINRFQIGYHPAIWQWLLDKSSSRFSQQVLIKANLATDKSSGTGLRDNLVDRITFPIRDSRGRTVAFGGRILPDRANSDAPKYWNSPGSSIYSKSHVLFGFDVAKEAVRKSKTVIVVEGYTDCILASQYGLQNVVAVLGTALTEQHVSNLKRFAQKVVLVYDGDDAGQGASERALAKLLAQEVDLRILTLPDRLDPADFLEKYGVDAFRAEMERSIQAWEHKLRIVTNRWGLNDPNPSVDARDRVLQEMLEFLSEAPSLIGTQREDILLGILAHRVGIGEERVRRSLADRRERNGRRQPTAQTGSIRIDRTTGTSGPGQIRLARTPAEVLEWELLEIIFAAPEYVELIQREIACGEIEAQQTRDLLQICYDLFERGELADFKKVMSSIEDSELKRLAVFLDERSRQKDVKSQLKQEPLRSGSDGIPDLLHHVLESWKFLRDSRSHERVRGDLARLNESTSADKELELLHQVSEFHKKRANRSS